MDRIPLVIVYGILVVRRLRIPVWGFPGQPIRYRFVPAKAGEWIGTHTIQVMDSGADSRSLYDRK